MKLPKGIYQNVLYVLRKVKEMFVKRTLKTKPFISVEN